MGFRKLLNDLHQMPRVFTVEEKRWSTSMNTKELCRKWP